MSKSIIHHFLIILVIVQTSCSNRPRKKDTDDSNLSAKMEVTSQSTLFFQGNFDGVTVDRSKISGWSELEAVPELENQEFGLGGSEQHVNVSTKSHDGEKVLYAEVIDDDPGFGGQTRFQWTMFLEKELEIVHIQYRLFLSPDIAELNNYSNSIKWFSLFEMWNKRANDLSAEGKYDGSARWNLNIHKDDSGSLYWAWEAEFMQPYEMVYHNLYPTQKNATSEIPLGRWFTLDIYFNRNGKTVVKADDNIIFDFVGQNAYPGRPELYPTAVNAFKLYTSDEILDWLRSRDKKVWAMYNDFKWYKL